MSDSTRCSRRSSSSPFSFCTSCSAARPSSAGLLSWLFVAAVIVLWVFLIINAFQGKQYKLPYIGDWAEEQTR